MSGAATTNTTTTTTATTLSPGAAAGGPSTSATNDSVDGKQQQQEGSPPTFDLESFVRDWRHFECQTWHLEPTVRLLSWAGKSIEPYGVDYI